MLEDVGAILLDMMGPITASGRCCANGSWKSWSAARDGTPVIGANGRDAKKVVRQVMEVFDPRVPGGCGCGTGGRRRASSRRSR